MRVRSCSSASVADRRACRAIVLLEEITSITDQVKFECRIVWKLMVNGAGRTKLLIDKSVLRNEVRAAGPSMLLLSRLI